MRKLLLFMVLVASFLFLSAGMAFAQNQGGDVIDQPALVFPAVGALLAWAISSIVIPYITAWSVDVNAPDWVSSGIAAVLAGLSALAAWVVDVPGIPDWKYAVGLFGLTVLGAVGFREGIEPTGLVRRDHPRSLYKRGGHLGASRARAA